MPCNARQRRQWGTPSRHGGWARLLTLLLSCSTCAATIDADELESRLDDSSTRIISARSPKAYRVVHIENAINVWHKDLYREGEIKGRLADLDEVAKHFADKGISPEHTLVVYDGGDAKFAGRIYWILKLLGAPDVRLLDGQMKQWRKGRRPVTSKKPKLEPAAFPVKKNADVLCTTEELRGKVGSENTVIVDVSSPEEYSGERGSAARKGHVAGAVNLDYRALLNDDGTLKQKSELESLLSAAGLSPDKEIILYCSTSVRTGIVFLALKAVLGYARVRVYDDGLMYWAADANNPMETSL